jgi:hypothetical protein
MRAMEVSINTVMMIFLFIIITAFLISFLFVNNVQATTSGYIPPQQTGDCGPTKPCPKGICMSINGIPNFCGCFEDTDCGGSPSKCVNKRCT